MKILSQILLLAFLAFFFLNFGNIKSPQPQTGQNVKSAQTFQCQANGTLPDQNCTPGAIDQNVTQENIFQTICKKGYTKTVRPPVDYTQKLKIEQIREYGYADTRLSDYEEDHLIPLELGGNPSDPKNLWPEPLNSAHQKDDIENLCNEKVCDGLLNLEEAQKEIAADWQTACH